MNDKSHAATPANATPDQFNAELRDGISSHMSAPQSVTAPPHADPIDWDKEPPPPLDHYENGVPVTTRQQAETVGERLKRLYPEHYVTIITRMNAERGSKATAIVLSNNADDGPYKDYTLSAVFLWSRTTEGHSFWAKLAERERS